MFNVLRKTGKCGAKKTNSLWDDEGKDMYGEEDEHMGGEVDGEKY